MSQRHTPKRFFWRRRTLLGIIALLLVCGSATYFYVSDNAAQRCWEQAQVALEADDLLMAIGHLEACTAARPRDAQCHFVLARTLRRTGQFDAATSHLARAEALGYDRYDIREEEKLTRLQRQSARKQSTEQLMAVVRGGQLSPPLLLETLYRADLAARDSHRAGLWLHLWLQNDPQAWHARLWQAELLERFESYDRARTDYLEVLKQQPDHPRALLGAGRLAFRQRGNHAEAHQHFLRCLQVDPKNAEARLGIARCFHATGNPHAASAQAQAALLNSDEAEAPLLLGIIAADAGSDTEALSWLKLAQSRGADARAVNHQLAQVYRRLNQPTEAALAHQRFAKITSQRQQLERLTRKVAKQPTVEGWHEMGQLGLLLGDDDVAIQWFDEALRIDPGHQASHAALAAYFAKQTDPDSQQRAQHHREQAAK